jgi:hypothetical protein
MTDLDPKERPYAIVCHNGNWWPAVVVNDYEISIQRGVHTHRLHVTNKQLTTGMVQSFPTPEEAHEALNQEKRLQEEEELRDAMEETS